MGGRRGERGEHRRCLMSVTGGVSLAAIVNQLHFPVTVQQASHPPSLG